TEGIGFANYAVGHSNGVNGCIGTWRCRWPWAPPLHFADHEKPERPKQNQRRPCAKQLCRTRDGPRIMEGKLHSLLLERVHDNLGIARPGQMKRSAPMPIASTNLCPRN